LAEEFNRAAVIFAEPAKPVAEFEPDFQKNPKKGPQLNNYGDW
jgi:hypothetical protein